MIEQEFHAAISAEKPTTSTSTTSSAQPPPQPSSHEAHVNSEGKRTDAELGEQLSTTTVRTQKIGSINDIEILETSFGVSACVSNCLIIYLSSCLKFVCINLFCFAFVIV